MQDLTSITWVRGWWGVCEEMSSFDFLSPALRNLVLDLEWKYKDTSPVFEFGFDTWFGGLVADSEQNPWLDDLIPFERQAEIFSYELARSYSASVRSDPLKIVPILSLTFLKVRFPWHGSLKFYTAYHGNRYLHVFSPPFYWREVQLYIGQFLPTG